MSSYRHGSGKPAYTGEGLKDLWLEAPAISVGWAMLEDLERDETEDQVRKQELGFKRNLWHTLPTQRRR